MFGLQHASPSYFHFVDLQWFEIYSITIEWPPQCQHGLCQCTRWGIINPSRFVPPSASDVQLEWWDAPIVYSTRSRRFVSLLAHASGASHYTVSCCFVMHVGWRRHRCCCLLFNFAFWGRQKITKMHPWTHLFKVIFPLSCDGRVRPCPSVCATQMYVTSLLFWQRK